MSNHLIEDLRQEIANGQVIAIVGAGVSIGDDEQQPGCLVDRAAT